MTVEDILSNKDFRKCADFHGHICPGLAIGYRASTAALDWLEENRAMDEEMVATVETDACGTDAVQVLTGCTLGKGNLIQKYHGKHVYTLVSRRSGEGVRVALKAGVLELSERHQELVRKLTDGEATPDDRKEFWKLHHQKAHYILVKPLKDLFLMRTSHITVPPKAMIEPSSLCERCGEPTMVSKLAEIDGHFVCRDCLGNDYRRHAE
jgi:formylmethanofuran dehydrogenase subunit E